MMSWPSQGKTRGAPITVRRILVHSTGHVQGQAVSWAKAGQELDRLVRTAGTHYHPTPADMAARAEQIARTRRVTGYLKTTITADPVTGTPVFTWSFDSAPLTLRPARTAGTSC